MHNFIAGPFCFISDKLEVTLTSEQQSMAVCGGPDGMQGCRVTRAQGMNLPVPVRG